MSAAGRDIGAIPEVVSPKRRSECENDLRLFLETYFPKKFTFAWADCHLEIIRIIQVITEKGGQYALALPRGTGKSTILECAAIWVAVYGKREYILIIAATDDFANASLEKIKTEIEKNDLLFEDFPEVCYPVRMLEGITIRANGQTSLGVRTEITWGKDGEIKLPCVEGSKASGIPIQTASMTGAIRGRSATLGDGRTVRPEFVLIDDPQTREVAMSTTQVRKRLETISNDILGLAGPGVPMSVAMPCTVITNDDVADQLLDFRKHPEWNGTRVKMLEGEPERPDLWDEYDEIRKPKSDEEPLEEKERRKSDAREFYRKNRALMDAGLKAYWEDRKYQWDVSAIQHAMDIKLSNPGGFAAEYQNEPLKPEQDVSEKQLTEEDIVAKLVGRRGEVPFGMHRLAMFIDVQKEVLFWAVCASDDQFTCHLVDYGAYPDQRVAFFDLNTLRKTLSDVYPKSGGFEAAILAGLNDFVNEQMKRQFLGVDGALHRIARIHIDAGWGEVTNIVNKFCRETEFSSLVYPSYGRGITAAQKPMSQYQDKPNEIKHYNVIEKTSSFRAVHNVQVDVNAWKAIFLSRLTTPNGNPGSMTIFGSKRTNHDMLIDHLTSEYFTVTTSSSGRVVKEFKLRPGRVRNDWLDCVVGCLVALHMTGISLPEWEIPVRKVKKVSLAVMQNRQKEEERNMNNAAKGEQVGKGDEKDSKTNENEQKDGIKTAKIRKISLKALLEKRRAYH